MSCGCASVPRSVLWAPSPPVLSARSSIDIQPGESIECYMARTSPATSAELHEAVPAPINVIVNNTFHIDPEGNFDEEIALSTDSTKDAAAWEVTCNGVPFSEAYPGATVSVTPTGPHSAKVVGNIPPPTPAKPGQKPIVKAPNNAPSQPPAKSNVPSLAPNDKAVINAKAKTADGSVIDDRAFVSGLASSNTASLEFIFPMVTPTGWPPPKVDPAFHKPRVTSLFGARTQPAEGASWAHQGIDISLAPSGTPGRHLKENRGIIVAAARGQVVNIGASSIAINHYHPADVAAQEAFAKKARAAGGTAIASTVYCHIHPSDMNVVMHQWVEAGQQIGIEGDKACKKGAYHLHFEIHRGRFAGMGVGSGAVDPLPYLYRAPDDPRMKSTVREMPSYEPARSESPPWYGPPTKDYKRINEGWVPIAGAVRRNVNGQYPYTRIPYVNVNDVRVPDNQTRVAAAPPPPKNKPGVPVPTSGIIPIIPLTIRPEGSEPPISEYKPYYNGKKAVMYAGEGSIALARDCALPQPVAMIPPPPPPPPGSAADTMVDTSLSSDALSAEIPVYRELEAAPKFDLPDKMEPSRTDKCAACAPTAAPTRKAVYDEVLSRLTAWLERLGSQPKNIAVFNNEKMSTQMVEACRNHLIHLRSTNLNKYGYEDDGTERMGIFLFTPREHYDAYTDYKNEPTAQSALASFSNRSNKNGNAALSCELRCDADFNAFTLVRKMYALANIYREFEEHGRTSFAGKTIARTPFSTTVHPYIVPAVTDGVTTLEPGAIYPGLTLKYFLIMMLCGGATLDGFIDGKDEGSEKKVFHKTTDINRQMLKTSMAGVDWLDVPSW